MMRILDTNLLYCDLEKINLPFGSLSFPANENGSTRRTLINIEGVHLAVSWKSEPNSGQLEELIVLVGKHALKDIKDLDVTQIGGEYLTSDDIGCLKVEDEPYAPYVFKRKLPNTVIPLLEKIVESGLRFEKDISFGEKVRRLVVPDRALQRELTF